MIDQRSTIAKAALEALLEAAEQARLAPDNRDLAIEAFRLGAVFIDAVLGPEIGNALRNGRTDTLVNQSGVLVDKAFTTEVLACVVGALSPIFLSAHPGFPVNVIVGDILNIGDKDGDTPLILKPASRKPGQKDHRKIKRTAQRRLILAVYHEAGRTKTTIENIRENLGFDITATQRSWERWLKTTPKSRRVEARRNGASATTSHPDLMPDVLKNLITAANMP